MRIMNESAQDLVLMDSDVHAMLGERVISFSKVHIKQLNMNAVFNIGGTNIECAKNFSLLNIQPPLCKLELTRFDFFEIGGVDGGMHFTADGIYCFHDSDTHQYGGIIVINGNPHALDNIKGLIEAVVTKPWSVFDHRIWFSSKEDASNLEVSLSDSY